MKMEYFDCAGFVTLVVSDAMNRFIRFAFYQIAIVTCVLISQPSFALKPTVGATHEKDTDTPKELMNVGITEKLGQAVPGDIQLTNHLGETVALRDLMNKGRPVVLLLAYYGCPSICSLFLDGAMKALKELDWNVGQHYDVLTVSFDHKEGPDLSLAARDRLLADYGRPGAEKGWYFLTGSEQEIKRLTDSVGFAFRWVEDTGEYAHGTALIFLTEAGVISRYLSGIFFQNRNTKLALVEAGQGKVGTIGERLIMYCFRYDPKANKYSLFAMRLMQAGGILTLMIILGCYLIWFLRKPRGLS